MIRPPGNNQVPGNTNPRLRAGYQSWVFALLLAQLPLVFSLPIVQNLKPQSHIERHSMDRYPENGHHETDELLFNMFVSTFLVLIGGVFAGLTLGLMGQDEVYLKVIEQTGEAKESKAASDVLALLSKGKHWVLVTLLLSNVITNETLPIVLDRLIGGGFPAIVSSTAAIVVFGEIIPQSICVKYGLSIGSLFAPLVLFLMYLLYPLSYPISLILDKALGEQHGTVYKRAGLKSLVTLHRDIGCATERLNEDEVTIISAVLDLKDKSVESIMTPITKAFVLPSDKILDNRAVEEILSSGFNRIPIHVPGDPNRFVGMLLVRTLITYDPEDCLPISSFLITALPETHPSTSCLNILNYFQEGRSHMVLVSANPGEDPDSNAIGVVTLEDVIEELIGEEIVDESDVYIDVPNSVMRKDITPFLSKKVVGKHAAPSPQTGTPRHHCPFGVDKDGKVLFFPSVQQLSRVNSPVTEESGYQLYDLDKKHPF